MSAPTVAECRACGARYDGETFARLALPRGLLAVEAARIWYDDGTGEGVELRQCSCGRGEYTISAEIYRAPAEGADVRGGHDLRVRYRPARSTS